MCRPCWPIAAGTNAACWWNPKRKDLSANRAAGLVVGKFGTASVTPEELEMAA